VEGNVKIKRRNIGRYKLVLKISIDSMLTFYVDDDLFICLVVEINLVEDVFQEVLHTRLLISGRRNSLGVEEHNLTWRRDWRLLRLSSTSAV